MHFLTFILTLTYCLFSKAVMQYPLSGTVSYLDAFVRTTETAVFVNSSQSIQKRHVSSTRAFVREPCVLSPENV